MSPTPDQVPDVTAPGWPRNYTATLDTAAWLHDEARRLGWRLQVVAGRR